MDINQLFRAGMRKCGRVLRILPEDEIISPTHYMMQVLKDETIPSLNIIYPRQIKTTFGINRLIQINDQTELGAYDHGLDSRYVGYRIPLSITEGLSIISIKSCIPTSSLDVTSGTGDANGYGIYSWNNLGSFGRYSSANMYEAVAYAQLNYADRQLLGQISSAFRYYFYPPNILLITSSYASSTYSLTVEFNLENDENLISIPDSAYEAIRRLFILDLKKTIYDEYGIHATVETQNGPLDLGIGDWSSAESERNELYDSYLATAHFRTSSMRTG